MNFWEGKASVSHGVPILGGRRGREEKPEPGGRLMTQLDDAEELRLSCSP